LSPIFLVPLLPPPCSPLPSPTLFCPPNYLLLLVPFPSSCSPSPLPPSPSLQI
jgi:hypothetical protein